MLKHHGSTSVPLVFEGPAGAHRPGLDAVGDLDRPWTLAVDGEQLGCAADALDRFEDAAAESLGRLLSPGRAKASPAEPRVERPDRAAVVGIRGVLRMIGGQGAQSPAGEDVRSAE